MFPFLLALQAAGMVTDYMGVQNQQRIGEMGSKIQLAGIESNIYQTRLEAEQSSLEALQNLRKTLGTQAVVLAARGTRSNAGSAALVGNESVGTFRRDERMRRLNLLGRETAIRGQGLITELNQQSETNKMWRSFAQRSANRFPTSTAGFSKMFGG